MEDAEVAVDLGVDGAVDAGASEVGGVVAAADIVIAVAEAGNSEADVEAEVFGLYRHKTCIICH